MNLRRIFCVLFFSLFFISCATPPKNVQPQVNSLVIARHFDRAMSFLGEDPSVYGPHNELLFWLDRGLTLHLAGRYAESTGAFETAKHKFDELYTRSVSQMAAAAAVNDYWQDYHGEDYEYVLVNIFQALNFAAMDNISEALVEARDVDNKLKLVNARYGRQKNVYSDDAFARFLSGILYEAEGSVQDLNDAYIDYTHARDVYQNIYKGQYGIDVPKVLQQDLLAVRAPDMNARRAKAEVFLFHYTGFVPLKVADVFPLPLDRSHVTAISFPKYADRVSDVRNSRFSAAGKARVQNDTEIVQDIGAIAKKILENRKALVLAGAALRPIGKYVLEKTAEESVRGGKNGDAQADAINVLANVYNLYSEKADVRGWQTLPEKIRAARLLLEPGRYEFFVEDFDENGTSLGKRSLGAFDLKAGQKKFLLTRSYR